MASQRLVSIATLDRLIAERDEAVSLLREAEWASQTWDEPACPWCHGFYSLALPEIEGKYSAKPPGHKTDCRLRALLRACLATGGSPRTE